MLRYLFNLKSRSLAFKPQRFFSEAIEQESYFSSTSFYDFDLHPILVKSLKSYKLDKLTNIQELGLKKTLKGSNSLILGETGSGKTLTYVIPILNQIYNNLEKNQSDKISHGAVVLAPTKELCSQIYSVFQLLDTQKITRLGRTGIPINPVVDVGNKESRPEPREKLINVLNWDDWDIVVSTPVKLDNILTLKDQKEKKSINPKIFVLDEYDLLLGDENICKSTRQLMTRFSKGKRPQNNKEDLRQFILCGATFARKIGSIDIMEEINTWVPNLEIVKSKEFHTFSKRINSESIEIPENTPFEKELEILKQMLDISPSKKILVFCNSAKMTTKVSEYLTSKDVPNLAVSAGMLEDTRLNNINQFIEENKYKVLVATDVAARGIDFRDVQHVIQFEYSTNMTGLMHRAGRTARCGSYGIMTNFVRTGDLLLYSKFNDFLKGDLDIDMVYSHKRRLNKRDIKDRKEEEEAAEMKKSV